MKHKERIAELTKKVIELLEDNAASEILDAVISECSSNEMDSLVDTMETELRYRGSRKMIKIETMDQEIKLEEFLDQLYPMHNDRQLAIL
jgi:restriction endonuclease Mrr